MTFSERNQDNKWTKIADFILNPELDLFKNVIKKVKQKYDAAEEIIKGNIALTTQRRSIAPRTTIPRATLNLVQTKKKGF